MTTQDSEAWMRRAIALAERGKSAGEVPVGAVVVLGGVAIGEGWNQPISRRDPTAHAEVMAMRSAGCRVDNYRLTGATLFVTLEPCVMCAGAILHARLTRVVFGAYDPRAGASGSVFDVLETDRLNHRVEVVGGVLAEPCGDVLRRFFEARRT